MEKTGRREGGIIKRFYQKLLFQLFMYFALVVCMFAILLGVIYMKLYEDNTIRTFRNDLVKKSERISQNVSNYAKLNDYKGFSSYLETMQSLFDKNETDIYIISNVNSQIALSSYFTSYNTVSQIESLPKAMYKIVMLAFEGKVASNKGYIQLYHRQSVCVAVPVKDTGGNVTGAVMLVSAPQDQMLLYNGQRYIIISSIAALIVSFVVSIFLAGKFSRPISAMRKVALRLSEGDYEAKSDIRNGGEIGELACSIDVLSDKLKENEVIRNNMEQTRRDFFANVSHELRTPITVMRGYSEMLVDGVVSKEEKKQQYYERMLGECKSMERLVGDLLILSKMQNPDFQIEKEPVNLIQVFHDIIRGIHVVAAKKQIEIECLHTEECIMMMGDYDRLRQMFLIILDNAVKFSNEQSHIKIEIEVHTNITIKITDQGIGIAQEELPYIFEKFYKSKLKQNEQGSGLGLVIAKQIAMKHGGVINVESELGKGSTFQFVFDKTCNQML
ncbi:sensor histidine kinase [[Clostridium] polysaccharolyticum]|uniref:histidine kinase n=1 Tax=[Clostridium] polysaccharolyticum TaxID=29364 RepID=A0A1H9ZFX3_9FIRM|nr:ATP-binding protein [[Clostridium] polysaccharolyticum]SES80571.1 Signal transduction histidine kinase [[Clostridium] polysaccharolyticum]